MSEFKELKDNSSIGEDSTTAKFPMYECQHGQINPSATISHEEPMLPKSSPPFTPKLDVLANKQPNMLSFSPALSVIQSVSQTQSQQQYATATSSLSGEEMIEKKKLTGISSANRPFSMCEVPIYGVQDPEHGEVCLSSLAQYEDTTNPPKSPPKLSPKPLPVSTSRHPASHKCKSHPKLRLKQVPKPPPKVSHLQSSLNRSASQTNQQCQFADDKFKKSKIPSRVSTKFTSPLYNSDDQSGSSKEVKIKTGKPELAPYSSPPPMQPPERPPKTPPEFATPNKQLAIVLTTKLPFDLPPKPLPEVMPQQQHVHQPKQPRAPDPPMKTSHGVVPPKKQPMLPPKQLLVVTSKSSLDNCKQPQQEPLLPPKQMSEPTREQLANPLPKDLLPKPSSLPPLATQICSRQHSPIYASDELTSMQYPPKENTAIYLVPTPHIYEEVGNPV